MFEIRAEWLEAPGVVDPVLARTWARLEIVTRTGSPTRYERSGSVRMGVFGAAFPMAAWIVDNWWALLHEEVRGPRVSVRRASADMRPWMSRHNLHTCREGMPYPDLAIFSENDQIVVRWFADPQETTLNGRFNAGGIDWLSRNDLRNALGQFVDDVIERLDGLEDERAHEFVENWQAILESTKHEQPLCARLGMLGLDPYAVDEAIEAAVQEIDLPEAIVSDLLAASSPSVIARDIVEARTFVGSLPASRPTEGSHLSAAELLDVQGALLQLAGRAIPKRPSAPELPYRVGYARAGWVRDLLQLEPEQPIEDLGSLLLRLVGDYEPVELSTPAAVVEAALRGDDHPALCFTPRAERQTRFLHARALHHWLFVTDAQRPTRLLTRSHGGVQAASRAFAAELLAPASALRAALHEGADWGVEEELAQRFNVSPMVIAHQLQNHDLL